MVKSTLATIATAALLAGQASALFPDCVNGPMSKNDVCDSSLREAARYP
jgi:hypothetical protein